MRLAVSRSHRSERIGAVCRRLGIEHEVRSGSVGLKIAMICEQVCDLYIHPSPHTKQWDTCAPEAIISEAGGRMTDLEGRPFTYNRADLYNRLGILASNGSSHDRILEVLRPIWAADH
jgi:3'(2'), 5'-bisphosphate nucleotidase